MPKNEFDPEDPMELVAVELLAASEECLREMAITFVEEFIRMGMTRDEILALFQNPFYQGPYRVWCNKGETYVREIIHQAEKVWARG